MVVGISPTLVALMVGSLLWFLTIVFYQGDYTWRLLFVHAMFIMGVVGITRISMEEGAAYAAMFAAPLALAVAVAYTTFVRVEGALAPISPLINLALEAVIWFSAHKLTWDCTLIDDSQDSSKEGLLQAMGWDRVEGEIAAPTTNGRATEVTAPAAPSAYLEATTSREVQVFHWLRSFFVPDKRPHTPGVWIIYFSLAALPLFGIGQWFIPSERLDLRRDAFWLLVVYVACGLGLLLNTSFLGLRRYLRQRNLLMPTEMAATWLGVGVTLILIVLAVVWLLPRPSAEYSVSQLDMFKSKPLDPSRWGWGKDGSKKPGKTGQKPAGGDGGQESKQAQSSKNGKSKNQSSGQGKGSKDGGSQEDEGKSSAGDKSQGGKSSGGKGTGKDKSNGGSKTKESGSDDQQGGNKSGDKSESKGGKPKAFDKDGSQSDSKNKSSKQKSDQQSSQQESQSSQQSSQESSSSDSDSQSSEDSENNGQQSEDSSSSQPRPTSSYRPLQFLSWLSPTVAQIIQWLFYGLVIVTLIVLAWIYRAEIIAAWKKLVAELRDLWNRWFGGKRPAAAAEVVAAGAPPRSFATYADPFASGMAGRATLAELVRYTFEALEAWGREHDSPRATGQTAHEYAQQVGYVHEPLAANVRILAELYGQLAYARSTRSQANLEPLKSLWQQMRGT
jgi:uncharacterized protein DUF4129